MAHRNFPESLSRMLKNLPNHLSTKSWNGKISTWMAKYEDFVGLTEVKAAQNRVLEVTINITVSLYMFRVIKFFPCFGLYN